MRYQQPDGFPITFNLIDAASVTDISVSRLRNYIARDILKHVGQIPLAGQERRFAIWGLYEIALIAALVEEGAGRSLETASKIVHAAFSQSLAAALLVHSQAHPDKVKGLDFASAAGLMESTPEQWLKGFWTYRDLRTPAVWVYGHLGGMLFGPLAAEGWHDVPAVVEDLQRQARTSLQADVKDIGLLNVTAVLDSIDRAVEERLPHKLK